MDLSNNCLFGGNLGGDPTLDRTGAGTPRCRFRLAVHERGGRGGSAEEQLWVRATVLGARAEALAGILRRGMRVTVAGRVGLSAWEDREGRKQTTLELAVEGIEIAPRPGPAAAAGDPAAATGDRAETGETGAAGRGDDAWAGASTPVAHAVPAAQPVNP